MNITIRSATLDDSKILAELNKEVHKLHVENLPSIFRQPSDTEMNQTFRMFLENKDGKCFVATVLDEIIGYVILFKHINLENPFCHERIYFELDQICVNHNFRKKGIAKLLVNEAINYVKIQGYKELHLSVWGFNSIAQKSFAALGFKEYYKRMVKSF